MRLWYERELVQSVCRKALAIDGNVDAISAEMQKRGGRVNPARRRSGQPRASDQRLALGCARASVGIGTGATDADPAIEPAAAARLDGRFSRDRARSGVAQGLRNRLSRTTVGEASAQARPIRLSFLRVGIRPSVWQSDESPDESKVRPQAQAVFCIDVRSEPLRRNLEATGDYETFGFAGFFAVAIRHQALGSHHETDQFPVILKSKNFVREIPRTYQGQFLFKSRAQGEASRRVAYAALRSQGKRLHALRHGGVPGLVLQPAACRQNPLRRPLSKRDGLGSGANSFPPSPRL